MTKAEEAHPHFVSECVLRLLASGTRGNKRIERLLRNAGSACKCIAKSVRGESRRSWLRA
jgi:hypothetical protein